MSGEVWERRSVLVVMDRAKGSGQQKLGNQRLIEMWFYDESVETKPQMNVLSDRRRRDQAVQKKRVTKR